MHPIKIPIKIETIGQIIISPTAGPKIALADKEAGKNNISISLNGCANAGANFNIKGTLINPHTPPKIAPFFHVFIY